MSKSRRLSDRRSKRRVKVDDAAEVVAAIQYWASQSREPVGAVGQWIRSVAGFMADRWADSSVVLRVDPEFAGALMNSNTDVDLVPDWLDRFPFNAVAYSLATPLSLYDGHRLCHYLGMLATGINPRPPNPGAKPPAPIARPDGNRFEPTGSNFTNYVNIPCAKGVRCLWVFKEDGDPGPQLQTVTFPLRGELANEPTLAGLIAAQIAIAHESGQSTGAELSVLIPLSLSLLLYTAASDPEIDWPPAEHIARPQHIRNTTIGNLGWRTGATLRRAREQPLSGRDATEGRLGLGGWRLPPHVRKAHWHRVRIVERDENGQVTGSRNGAEGEDWHYEVRWYPPAAVNAESGLAPAVRDMQSAARPASADRQN